MTADPDAGARNAAFHSLARRNAAGDRPPVGADHILAAAAGAPVAGRFAVARSPGVALAGEYHAGACAKRAPGFGSAAAGRSSAALGIAPDCLAVEALRMGSDWAAADRLASNPPATRSGALLVRSIAPSITPQTEDRCNESGAYRIDSGACTPSTPNPEVITCLTATNSAMRAAVIVSTGCMKRKCGDSLPRVYCPCSAIAVS